MLDAAIAVQVQELSIFTIGGVPQHRGAESHGHTYIRAPYGAFATSDGYLALAMPSLKVLGEILGSPPLMAMDDHTDGHTRKDEITALTRAGLVTRTTAEWMPLLLAAGIWVGPVYGYADLQDDPQVRHNGSFVTFDHPTEGTVTMPGFPYRFSRTAPEIRFGAPLSGEHTAEILAELGHSSELDELVAAGAVAAVSTPAAVG